MANRRFLRARSQVQGQFGRGAMAEPAAEDRRPDRRRVPERLGSSTSVVIRSLARWRLTPMFWKRGRDGNQARRVAGEVNAYRASRGRVRSLLVVSVPSRDETCVVKSSAMDEREEIVASPPYGLRGWHTVAGTKRKLRAPYCIWKEEEEQLETWSEMQGPLDDGLICKTCQQ